MLSRLRQLSKAELLDLYPALWRLALVRFSLLVFGFRRTLERFDQSHANQLAPPSPVELESWRRRSRAFRRVGRLIPQAHCLARSIALRWWMRSQGVHALLKIGVRKDHGQIDSHAWVEANGVPVDEREAVVSQYQVVQTDNRSQKGWATTETP